MCYKKHNHKKKQHKTHILFMFKNTMFKKFVSIMIDDNDNYLIIHEKSNKYVKMATYREILFFHITGPTLRFQYENTART